MPPERFRALDWLRGGAVLVMIQCHAMNKWLLHDLRGSELFRRLDFVDGLVAPSFLFAAGFSLALVQLRGGVTPARLRKSAARLGEVLAVAVALTAIWFPVFREPRWLLRLDILHCLGLTLLGVLGVLWGLSRAPRLLVPAFVGLGAAAFAAAPLCEHAPGWLSHFVSTRLGSPATPSESIFPLLPWAGHVLLGAAAGTVAARHGRGVLAGWLLAQACVGSALWWNADAVTALFPPHDRWVNGAAWHGNKFAWVTGMALLLLAVERGVQGEPGHLRRVLERLGTSSLSAYAVHQLALSRQKPALGWGGYWAATAGLWAFTYLAVLGVERAEAAWARRRTAAA
jgi:uncharacterized membrane protein